MGSNKEAEGGGRERVGGVPRPARPWKAWARRGAAVGDEGEEPRKPAAAYEEEVTGTRRSSHGEVTAAAAEGPRGGVGVTELRAARTGAARAHGLATG